MRQENDGRLKVLVQIVTRSNHLAKQLRGEARQLAYRVKADACSFLVTVGAAKVNGIWPNGIIALSLGPGSVNRIHIRRAHLTPEARQMLSPQLRSAPVVGRLQDRFDQKLVMNDEEL